MGNEVIYDVEDAHQHSSYNRIALSQSKTCGCFDCMEIFSPTLIEDYVEEEPDDTAICPFCGNDSIIGDKSGYPITSAFLKRMRRRWCESGAGLSIETPFGSVTMYLDDKPIWFHYRSIDPVDGLFPDVEETYRINVNLEPDGQEHYLKLQINDCNVEGYPESGERLEAISFYQHGGKVTLGSYASFGDYEDYELDFDGCLCPDGIELQIFPATETNKFKFAVCWLNECNEDNDIQTWFGADPQICGF